MIGVEIARLVAIYAGRVNVVVLGRLSFDGMMSDITRDKQIIKGVPELSGPDGADGFAHNGTIYLFNDDPMLWGVWE